MLYKIRFYNEDKLYELYANSVHQSDMFGFLVIEDLVFGEQSELIVNPADDQLRAEFSATKRIFLPMQNVVMIEEVQKRGKAKIIKTDFRPNPAPVRIKEDKESG